MTLFDKDRTQFLLPSSTLCTHDTRRWRDKEISLTTRPNCARKKSKKTYQASPLILFALLHMTLIDGKISSLCYTYARENEFRKMKQNILSISIQIVRLGHKSSKIEHCFCAISTLCMQNRVEWDEAKFLTSKSALFSIARSNKQTRID